MQKILKLNVNTKNKEFMFNLRRLFAKGVQIQIENIDEVDDKISAEEKLGQNKSFNMMIKYWHENKLCPNINVGNFNKNGIFIICPEKNITNQENSIINAYINYFKKNGKLVYCSDRYINPEINAINTDCYNICLQNAIAMSQNKTTAIYYNKKCIESMFDLGVAYELIKNDASRSFQILNFKLELNKNDFIDNKILELFYLNKERNPSLEDLINNIPRGSYFNK